jgi:hypothetical protein
MDRISVATLPAGYTFEWTGTALQEKAASGQAGIVLGLAIFFAYLFLVALYESWNIPARRQLPGRLENCPETGNQCSGFALCICHRQNPLMEFSRVKRPGSVWQ